METTTTNLNHGILNRMPTHLPPTEGQARIVARADQLMTLCEQLKSRLSEAQTTQLQLADTVVDETLDERLKD